MEKLGSNCKKYMVEEIKKKIDSSSNLFVSSLKKVPVGEQDQLRQKLHEVDATLLVVKNRLAKQAFKQLKKDELSSLLSGMTALSFGGNDSLAIPKTLVKFAESQENFKILGGYADEQILDLDSIKKLAAIPSKEILLAQLIGGIQAPIQGFVNSLSGTIKKFVLVVDKIREHKS